MLLLLILAAVSLIVGLALLVSNPNAIEQLLNKVVIKSAPVSLKLSKLLGIGLIILAALLFYIRSTQ